MNHVCKRSTLLSIALHLLVIITILTLNSVNKVIIPSRSDGIEVSLIAQSDITPIEKKISTPKPVIPITAPIKNSAEINVKPSIKQDQKPIKKEEESKVLKIVKSETVPPKKVVTNVPPKTITSKEDSTLDNLVQKLDKKADKSLKNNKGQVLGGTTNGTSNTNNLKNNYADQIIALIRPHIRIPDNIDKDATVIIEITLLPNMEVLSTRMIKSSGNLDYDTYVEQAINRVKIFPPIPAKANWVDYRVLRITFKP